MNKDFTRITYEIEEKFLSPFAQKTSQSKGREVYLEPSPMRTEYARDKDRIIHCKAFRRLKHKTQVFLAPEGDHYRTRLTHTLEVSQIARSIGRALRLNEDLIEAISLGHDLGHTPYGHAGERALNEYTHFEHNEQSLRVVDCLEYNGKGMNLTFEVRDGILNHTSRGDAKTLEGHVVSWSDRIAYINHDIDDAIRGGIIKNEDLPLVYRKTFGENTGNRLNSMIMDVVTNSYGKNFVSPSDEYKEKINGLRKWMFENVYFSPIAKGEEGKAVEMIKFLYEYYYSHKDQIPREFLDMDSSLEQKVCDYIAMMSDQYAVKVFEDITIPKGWSKL